MCFMKAVSVLNMLYRCLWSQFSLRFGARGHNIRADQLSRDWKILQNVSAVARGRNAGDVTGGDTFGVAFNQSHVTLPQRKTKGK